MSHKSDLGRGWRPWVRGARLFLRPASSLVTIIAIFGILLALLHKDKTFARGLKPFVYRRVVSRRLRIPHNFTVTVLTSVYCCNPYSPSSRPIPDCLNPPKGA